MCQVGQNPLLDKPDLGGPDALGAQFLERVHLGQQSKEYFSGSWLCKLATCVPNTEACCWRYSAVLAGLGEALVALMQGHHCNYDPPMLIIPSIQIFQQLHNLPHCGCLGLQKGWFVPVSGGGQALESVTLHPLLLVEVKDVSALTSMFLPKSVCPGGFTRTQRMLDAANADSRAVQECAMPLHHQIIRS